MFGKQKPDRPAEPGNPAQLAMVQTIAKMIGVPPEVLSKAFYTIASAGDRLERLEAKIDYLINTGGNSAGFGTSVGPVHDPVSLAGPQPAADPVRPNGDGRSAFDPMGKAGG